MNCQEAKVDLALLVGHDLEDASRREELRRHVATCPQCRQHLRGLKSSLAVLEHVDPELTYVSADSLWPDLKARLETPSSARPPREGGGSWISWSALALSLVVCVTVFTPIFWEIARIPWESSPAVEEEEWAMRSTRESESPYDKPSENDAKRPGRRMRLFESYDARTLMIRSRRLAPLSTILLALLGFASLLPNRSSTAADDAQVTLRYRFQPGQVVRYHVDEQANYHVQVGTTTEDPHSHQTSQKSYRVLEVLPDGSARLELSIDQVKIDLKQNEESFQYDSSKDAAPGQMFQQVASMVGKPYLRLTASPIGLVSDIQALAGGTAPEASEKDPAIDVFVPLPEEPVSVGTIWREDFSVEIHVSPTLKKSVKLQRRFRLESIDGSRAKIAVETVVLTPIRDPDEEIQLIRRTPRGSITLDIERGLLVDKSLSLENRVSGFGGTQSLMTIEQSHREKIIEATASGTPATRTK
ncbi:Uncharacterized protein SCF082_LOCUS49599 [Durusdinium trenchii]|uniref:Zinc-finger domain-containing protein n=1 Tax=Durusdinium trenchii TaxID=1381693 RepID=A0ABP0S2E4_9DINO